MKILSTDKFQDKLISLEKPNRDLLVKFIDLIKNYNYEKIVNSLSYHGKLNEIAVYKLGDIRIFYDFIDDYKNEKTMLFLDLTVEVPNVSYSKNPRFNSTINPRFNSTINPRFNSTINPRFNSTINPRFNSTINPRFNSTINPKLNPAFNGYFYYDLSIVPLEYIIPINNNEIMHFFDFANNFIKYGIKANENFYNVFNVIDNEWVGYCVSDNQGGFNYFNISGEWLGFIK